MHRLSFYAPGLMELFHFGVSEIAADDMGDPVPVVVHLKPPAVLCHQKLQLLPPQHAQSRSTSSLRPEYYDNSRQYKGSRQACLMCGRGQAIDPYADACKQL